MNRYAITGARLDMAAGLNVVVVMPSRELARRSFEQVHAELVDGEACKVVKVNGLEEIHSASGGSIRFVGQRDVRLLRTSADVVVAADSVRDDHADELRRIVLRSRVDDTLLPA